MVPELTNAWGLSTSGLSSFLGMYYYTYAAFAILAGAAFEGEHSRTYAHEGPHPGRWKASAERSFQYWGIKPGILDELAQRVPDYSYFLGGGRSFAFSSANNLKRTSRCASVRGSAKHFL